MLSMVRSTGTSRRGSSGTRSRSWCPAATCRRTGSRRRRAAPGRRSCSSASTCRSRWARRSTRSVLRQVEVEVGVQRRAGEILGQAAHRDVRCRPGRARRAALRHVGDERGVRDGVGQRSSSAPVHDAPLGQQEQEVERVAQRAGGEDRRVHLFTLNTCCASMMRWPRPFSEPMNISATITITSAIDTALRRPTKVGCRLSQQHVLEHLPARHAHDLRRHHALLARVHDAVGAVEQHDQHRAEGGDGDLVDVGDAEDQQEQRDQRRRRRGAEEVDQELDAAIGAARCCRAARPAARRSRRRWGRPPACATR